MTRLEMAGVVLEGREMLYPGKGMVTKWYVDGEQQKDADAALDLFLQRVYPSTQELPVALRRYIRRFAGNQLAYPVAMVRKARGGMTQSALAKASGVSKSTISRIERGKSNPTASVLFNITHAADSRRPAGQVSAASAEDQGGLSGTHYDSDTDDITRHAEGYKTLLLSVQDDTARLAAVVAYIDDLVQVIRARTPEAEMHETLGAMEKLVR